MRIVTRPAERSVEANAVGQRPYDRGRRPAVEARANPAACQPAQSLA